MATKKELKEIAGKGQWDYSNGEYRCDHCGGYRFADKHEDDCPLCILLQSIEDSDLE